MQKITSKQSANKDIRALKQNSNTSKNKKQKQLKQSSSKNIKTYKMTNQKAQYNEENKVKQAASPDLSASYKDIQNDYGVNPYYTKYKVKTSKKKQSEGNNETNQYGNMRTSKDSFNKSSFQQASQKRKNGTQQSDYTSSAFQKLKLPNNRGVINAEGKFISVKPQKQISSHSFHHKSVTKNSFSLNFTSNDSKRKKLGKYKSKLKKKIDSQKSLEHRIKHRSLDKIHIKNHTSYYEKSKEKSKDQLIPNKVIKAQSKQISQKQVSSTKIQSTNSKATSIGTQLEVYSRLDLIHNNTFIEQAKQFITEEIESSKAIIKKIKISQQTMKQRLKCIQMISKICGVMNMKRQTFSLTIHYLDKFISQFAFTSLKLVALSSLTLALKIDDAQMTSRFCFHYLCNPERTVKKSGSNHFKIKEKRESVINPKQEGKEMKSKLASILTCKISEQKRPGKQEFDLQQVLDFQNQIMLRFDFKLVTKTTTYWIDLLTTLWDSFIGEFFSQHFDTLVFRNDRSPRNFCYLLHLLMVQELNIDIHGKSKVIFALAAIYLITRMALQQKKEQTPWQELCRYYKVSLSKTTNLVFCDGIGINSIFGGYLSLFELSMTNIVNQVQNFSKYLQPNLIKITEYRKIEGLNRQDRLSTHIHSEQCFKTLGL